MTPEEVRKRKTKTNPKGGGNPNLKKGCNNVRGENDPAGAIIAPVRPLKVYVKRCADFMDSEGWALLEEVARQRHSKSQVPALKILAAYGYGNPDSTLDLTSGGKTLTSIAEFLGDKAQPSNQVGGT